MKGSSVEKLMQDRDKRTKIDNHKQNKTNWLQKYFSKLTEINLLNQKIKKEKFWRNKCLDRIVFKEVHVQQISNNNFPSH